MVVVVVGDAEEILVDFVGFERRLLAGGFDDALESGNVFRSFGGAISRFRSFFYCLVVALATTAAVILMKLVTTPPTSCNSCGADDCYW